MQLGLGHPKKIQKNYLLHDYAEVKITSFAHFFGDPQGAEVSPTLIVLAEVLSEISKQVQEVAKFDKDE